MPYITNDRRDKIIRGDNIYMLEVCTEGELNFAITTMIARYVSSKGIKYAVFNAAVGALECCKQELYRRMVGPYEDVKRVEHGDVY